MRTPVDLSRVRQGVEFPVVRRQQLAAARGGVGEPVQGVVLSFPLAEKCPGKDLKKKRNVFFFCAVRYLFMTLKCLALYIQRGK